MTKTQPQHGLGRAFWFEKVFVPIIVPALVTIVGGASFVAVKDLRPIHLETGDVFFARENTDKACLCRNTVRKSRLNIEAPVDANGAPCFLSADISPHLDRRELGPYFLTSEFVPNVSVADRRCFRQSTISVSDKAFSSVPTVSLQITWLDAIIADATELDVPVLLTTSRGVQIPKGLNVRFELLAKNITRSGFDVVLRTWYDSRIYAAKVTYVAFIQ
jgi:hypothetical protein